MNEEGRPAVPIRAVWFDVGETLIDESREYGTWADWLGVPRHTFSAVFGAVIARGGDYREVFQHFWPGFDLCKERQARLDAGIGEFVNGYDLYPDARPCLQALKDAGFFVGVAGNQTARIGRFLRELNLPCDVLATSDEWGAAKPEAGFFDKMVAVSGHNCSEIAYVGDRLDNDIAPAARAGLFTVWIRRGPWGYILAPGEAPVSGSLPEGIRSLTVRSLVELVTALTQAKRHDADEPSGNERAS
jgi:HAD superfamily hydrolase (TIGR01549 family)